MEHGRATPASAMCRKATLAVRQVKISRCVTVRECRQTLISTRTSSELNRLGREAQRQADEVLAKSRGGTVRVNGGVQFRLKGPGFPWRLWVVSSLHRDDCRWFPGCTVFVGGPSRRQQKWCRRRG
ncbi:hypothetical protein Dimus_015991 [Dionaea muscipula]